MSATCMMEGCQYHDYHSDRRPLCVCRVCGEVNYALRAFYAARTRKLNLLWKAGEKEFQAALDANPLDHTIRLVLADWLEERGDERAAGYRLLGSMQKAPSKNPYKSWAFHRYVHGHKPEWFTPAGELTAEMYSILTDGGCYGNSTGGLSRYAYCEGKSRKVLEDRFAQKYYDRVVVEEEIAKRELANHS